MREAQKVVAGRQDTPHAHWTGFSPDNRYAFVPDLGLDRVVIYQVDVKQSKLTPHGEGILPPGSGPRHMKFHPNGRWIYVLNELSLTVTLFDYDPAQGTMTPRQTVETVPAAELEFEKAKSASEIRVHANGKFVYSANRGHDSITAFEVNQDNGELKVIQSENARAITPRNFNISPDGNWLLCAGQISHTLAAFSLDTSTGTNYLQSELRLCSIANLCHVRRRTLSLSATDCVTRTKRIHLDGGHCRVVRNTSGTGWRCEDGRQRYNSG
ncbi:MAG: lactonase family protein [Nitrosomonas sp.]